MLVTSIYGAGEAPIPGVTAELVADAALKSGHRDVVYLPEREAVIEHLARSLSPGDIVVTLGAGDIWKVADDVMRRLAGD